MRAFRLAYDGQGYHGFQRQPDVETVEDTLFDALGALGVLDDGARKPDGYAAAGRTDKGVSALSQTVSFACPEWCTPRALNAALPAAIRAWAASEVPQEFHATHDATAREYTYHLRAPEADRAKARAVLDRLSGTHDFHNLTPDDERTTRTLATALEIDEPFLVLRFRAGGFSRRLVRRAVSLVRDVLIGERSLSHVDRVLSAERLDGPAGIGPSPPYPLVLTAVAYPNVEFAVDERAAASTREIFAARRADHETRARVAGTVTEGVR